MQCCKKRWKITSLTNGRCELIIWQQNLWAGARRFSRHKVAVKYVNSGKVDHDGVCVIPVFYWRWSHLPQFSFFPVRLFFSLCAHAHCHHHILLTDVWPSTSTTTSHPLTLSLLWNHGTVLTLKTLGAEGRCRNAVCCINSNSWLWLHTCVWVCVWCTDHIMSAPLF